MSYRVSLRADEPRLDDDRNLVLRLGTDGDVDQTIRSSLGHYLAYADVLTELSLPGGGALTLSVYLLDPGRSPSEFRTGPLQRAYRTTSVGAGRSAGVPIWATDVEVEGRPVAMSNCHLDLVVSLDSDVLPDTYAAAGKAERRRLRDLLRPRFEYVLGLFGPTQLFDAPDPDHSPR